MSHVHDGCSHLHGAALHRPTSINNQHDAQCGDYLLEQEEAA